MHCQKYIYKSIIFDKQLIISYNNSVIPIQITHYKFDLQIIGHWDAESYIYTNVFYRYSLEYINKRSIKKITPKNVLNSIYDSLLTHTPSGKLLKEIQYKYDLSFLIDYKLNKIDLNIFLEELKNEQLFLVFKDNYYKIDYFDFLLQKIYSKELLFSVTSDNIIIPSHLHLLF